MCVCVCVQLRVSHTAELEEARATQDVKDGARQSGRGSEGEGDDTGGAS